MSLRIRPLAVRPECGVNLSLKATLNDCFCKGECVAMWGPYEFEQEAPHNDWQRIGTQIARLNSGCVMYKCVDPDTGSGSTYVSNCIHAVTDLDRHLHRPAYNEFQHFGFDAGRFLVQILAQRKRLDKNITHPWIAEALGIDNRVRPQQPASIRSPVLAVREPGAVPLGSLAADSDEKPPGYFARPVAK
jgi:hypothetical protein